MVDRSSRCEEFISPKFSGSRNDSKDVFVIMPFSSTPSCTAEQWTEIFELVFKPAVESAGFGCERAAPETGSLIGSIVSKLRHARIVIADITDRNPNVFYELGVRHSLSKRTIIVTQNSEHVPSDLRGYWFVKYGTSPKQVVEFRKEIARLIDSVEKNPDKADSPVSDYLEQENINISTVINTENLKKLTALYTEFTGNLVTLRQIRDSKASSDLITTDCIRLLLSTLYLDLGSDVFKDLYELHNKLRLIQAYRFSTSLIDSTIQDCARLAEAVLSIRTQLAIDQYKEPDNLSLMMWRPIEQSPFTLSNDLSNSNVPLNESLVCALCEGTGMITDPRGTRGICIACGR